MSTLATAFLCVLGAGQEGYEPSPGNLAARQWFQDATFGLFVHWGVYSVLGRGEWVMHNEQMTVEEYEKLPPQFNPTEFDADAWCEMAKAAGMRYITITSKHHDGFAMYDSEVSGYDIVDATPYGQDVLKQLAEACERHGLKLFFYYSQLDWHHPDYYPRGRTGAHTGRPDDGEWQDYLAYMDAQLAELLTRYGDIGGIWFDGWWDKPDADWRLGETYALIHRLRPDAMIGSNHHREPFPGEDFQMFEKGLPGKDPFSEGGHVSELPLETCETINNSWGYNAGDDAHKSAEEIIRLLVKAAGNDANLLLNVGPKPDGTIQETHRERLLAVGEWLKGHGEAVYGTRGGPIAPQSWGVTTQDAGHVYVHVLSGDPVVALPPLDGEITGARTLAGEPVAYQATGVGVILRVPEQLREETDAVIVLDRPR